MTKSKVIKKAVEKVEHVTPDPVVVEKVKKQVVTKRAKKAELKIDYHASDCATHNMPAYPNGPCNCGLVNPRPVVTKHVTKAPVDEGDPVVELIQKMNDNIQERIEKHAAKEAALAAIAPDDRKFMLSELRARFETLKVEGKVDEMIAVLDEIAVLEKHAA